MSTVVSSPLEALYDALTQNISGTTLNLYPGAVAAGSGPVADALALLSAAGVSVSGVALSPWPSPTITVTGGSTFAGNPFTITATFTLDTDQKTIVMSLAMDAATLTFANAPWFSVDAPALTVTSKPVSGSLAGTVTFTDGTTSTTAAITGTLPADRQAAFSVTFGGSAPSLQALYAYIGGFDLVASLPSPLNVFTALTLNSVAFTYDLTQASLTHFTVDLTTTPQPPWNVVGKLTFTTMDIAFTVDGPTGKRAVSWVATPKVQIGKGTIDATISYPPFSLAGALDPASVPPSEDAVTLADVITFFLPQGITVPVAGELTAFDMTITPGTGAAKTTYTITSALNTGWAIPPSSPIFTVDDVNFTIDGTKATPTGSVGGSITFFATKPSLTFGLDVNAAYDGTVWTITGKTTPDSTIHVSDIIANYVGPWWKEGLPDFAIADFDATIVTGTDGTWTIAAAVPTFTIPALDVAFSNVTGSFGNALAGGAPFAAIAGDSRWWGVDLQFGFDYKPAKQSYTLTWRSVTVALTDEAGDWTATITLQADDTLGSLVETFVSWATGYAFGLAAPWSVLNDISLQGLSLTYDFGQKTVTLTVPFGLNLGFCDITGVKLVYNATAPAGKSHVSFALLGTFPWLTDGSDKLEWDATKPESTQQPPGTGNESFQLRLLALGQHVTIADLASAQTVEAAIAALAKAPPNDGSDDQQYLPPVSYDAGTDWLAGTDFGLLKLSGDDAKASGADYAITLQIVFIDPSLYGLRIALEGGPAKILAGLDFEIMYRKVSDTIGVYQAQITLPAALRTIQTGVFTIQLPIFAIEVFTNGDFQADFGFPWNADFSRSFTVQAQVGPLPLTGSAGFYFGKLSSATSNAVPAVTNGTFDPVIVFGFGVQAGFGKSLSMGPLSASFSLTVLAIIEGVIARWNPYQLAEQGATSKTQLDGSYFYRLSGTFGVAGILQGSIDFVVVKASVYVSVVLTAQITFTAYEPVVISVSVEVDVTASLSIDLGLFSITLHFSFSLDLQQTFQIGDAGSAPWTLAQQPPAGLLSAPLAQRLSAERARRGASPLANSGWITTPNWDVFVRDPADPVLPLTAYLSYSLTAAGDGASSAAQQQVCYVALLALDNQTPLAQQKPPVPPWVSATDTSFDALAKLVARWTVAAFFTPAAPGTLTWKQLDAQTITVDALDAIASYLADDQGTTPVPTPPPDKLAAMLQGEVALDLWGPADVYAAGITAIQGAFFPMIPQLALATALGATQQYAYAFNAFNTLAPGGAATLRTYFDQLALQTQAETPSRALRGSASPAGSVADFVFGDYFLMIARQMVSALRDGLRTFQYTLNGGGKPQTVIDAVNGAANGFTVADLFAANAAVPFTGKTAITIAGSATTIAPAETSLAKLAARFPALTTSAIAGQNLLNTGLLQPLVPVTYGGETIAVNGGDSFTSLASRFTAAPDPLTLAVALAAQDGLVMAFARVLLPPLTYTTAASGDTPGSVAAQFGVTPADLGPPNAQVADVFAPANGLLAVPHLTQGTVGMLLDEVARTGATSRLASMVSRFHLHGLRLPTVVDGVPLITPNVPGMWVQNADGTLTLPPSAGLYALTGQQFPLPPITSAAFTIAVDGTNAPPWVTFKNGTKTMSSTVVPAANVQPPQISAAPIEALRALVTGANYRFASGYTDLGEQSGLVRTAASYAFGTFANWIAPAAPALPNGTPAAGFTPRVWSFPTALASLTSSSGRAVAPSFALRTQTYDEASRKTLSTDVACYGWATRVGFTIKRVAPTGATAGAQTYEIVGASAADIVVLEDLVAQFTTDASFTGLWLMYAPDPSLQVAGLQCGSAKAAYGIGQANLSTVTHPPAGVAGALRRELGAVSGPVALNGNATFLRLLWEASITAQGGFYLFYDDNGPLPDHLFDKDGVAALTALAVYATSTGNALASCVNAAVVGDAFDPSRSSLVAVATPVATTQTMSGSQSVADFAAAWFTDLADLANDNLTTALTPNVQIAVNAGTYMVSPLGTQPGGDLAAIAQWFGVDAAALSAANPRIDWSKPLAAYGAVRLPALTVAAGASFHGTALGTLGAIATAYGADAVALVVDNQTLQGVFAGPASLAGGPTTRASKVPPGSQFIALQRAVPAPVPASSDPTYPQLLMQNQFSLLGYAVDGTPDFAASNLGAPVGPTGSDAWTYNVALAYGALVTGAGPGTSPYLGVGRLLQVDLAWLDVYGNEIISDLSSPQSGDTGTLNQTPVLIGYTDALVGLAQWPSANATWRVGTPTSAQANTAELQLLFSFDPSRYTTADPKANAASAKMDGAAYAQLATQLGDPNGTAFSVETSLLATPLDVSGANETLLTTWLAAILTYLGAIAGGTTAPAVPAGPTLSFDFPIGTVNVAQIFELTCAFTLARTGGVVEGEFATVPGIRSVTATVGANGAESSSGLAAFAKDFEGALASAEAVLRVATGPNRYAGGSATSSTLWAVRVGVSGSAPISYAIEAPKTGASAPLIFAPAPLSQQLISRSVPIYGYDSTNGINFTSGATRAFTNVDVDVWLRSIFATVDELLSPEYISALVILDEVLFGTNPPAGTMTNLGALIANKTALAAMYKAQMTAVFTDQQNADATTVAEAFAQSMLERLGNAYRTQAALQYAADVAADIPEPPPTNQTPNLYGPIVQTGAPNPGVSFSAPKIPLTTATGTPLAFLVTTPSTAGDTSSSHVAVSLAYAPSNIEHQREAIPAILGNYVASSWLQFVRPRALDDPASLVRTLGDVDVPMVLREYPANPAIAGQTGSATFSGALPPGDVTQATQWTYTFTYALPGYYPQDTVYGTVTFNVAPQAEALDSFVDAFGWLAEFVTTYPDVAKDLEANLATLPPAPDPTSPKFVTAKVAIGAVNAMLGKITGVSPVEAKQHRPQTSLAVYPSRPAIASASGDTWSFTLSESRAADLTPPPPGVPADALVVSVSAIDGPVPAVQLAGCTTTTIAPATPGAPTQYWFTRSGAALTFAQAQALGRSLVYGAPDAASGVLHILDKQDAQLTMHVTRNENLVHGRTTRDLFVYRTADVTPSEPCMPSIAYTQPIDIASVGTSQPPAKRSLQQHLAALFDALIADASGSSMTLQLVVEYRYTVNAAAGVAPMPLPVTVPILMQPPLPVAWSGAPPPQGVTLEAMIDDVTAAVTTWFGTTQPSSADGTLVISLAVLSTLTTTPMPLLRLTDLELAVADISPPLVTQTVARAMP